MILGMELTLEIVMPGETVELRHLRSVVFQTNDGEVGILPGHLPMICLVDVGLLCAIAGDREDWFVTGEGLARIANDRVSLLLQDLIAEHEIDEAAALHSLESAKMASTLPEFAAAPDIRADHLREIRRAEAQLALLERTTRRS